MSNIVKKQRLKRNNRILLSSKIPKRPPRGWIREIRQSLCMPERFLGAKLGVQQSTISHLQKSEVEGTITLQRLSDIAEAMGCELKYVLVPKKDLYEVMKTQAEKFARKLISCVDKTMSLEDQKVSKPIQEEHLSLLVNDFIQKMDSVIWEAEDI